MQFPPFNLPAWLHQPRRRRSIRSLGCGAKVQCKCLCLRFHVNQSTTQRRELSRKTVGADISDQQEFRKYVRVVHLVTICQDDQFAAAGGVIISTWPLLITCTVSTVDRFNTISTAETKAVGPRTITRSLAGSYRMASSG